VAFLPESRQVQACRVAEHIGQRLGGWVRGQLLLSAIIGTMTLVGLTIIGVPYAVLLSLVAAIGEAVPMIGPIVSAVPAIIIAFFVSPVQGFLTLGLYIVIQQLENNLVVPKVMGRAVSLHPVAVMLALLAGSELMGVTGAILAVPVTAALSVIVDEVRSQRIEHGMVQPSVASATETSPQAAQRAEPAIPVGGD
jgi:predicted PurR-regulated permease PerM